MQSDRSFPMQLGAMGSARVQEVIGLACWKYTAEGREPELKPNVDRYALYIGES